MRSHVLLPVVVAAAALTACGPYENVQQFLYSIEDAWAPEGPQVVHRRFVDDVDFPGVPEGEWRVTYAAFLQHAADEGAVRDAITCDGAVVSSPDVEAPWSTHWTGTFELWAETESGHKELLGAATVVGDQEMNESLTFAVEAINLMEVNEDFAAGAFDIVLKGTPVGPVDEAPPLELMVSFGSEARRGAL